MANVVKAAAVQISPVLYSRQGTVEKLVKKGSARRGERARQMPDKQIARLLNRAGKPTGRGNGWTQVRVYSFRSHYGIAVHRESKWAERGEITLEAAAQVIGVSVMTALRMARLGIIKGRQVCRGAPWIFEARRHCRLSRAERRASSANSFDFQ